MGSLTSRPVPPPIQRPVILTVPAVLPPLSTVSRSAGSNETGAPSDSDIQARARQGNLLKRRRGRAGTVLTSFRGILNQNNKPQRKTLLGE